MSNLATAVGGAPHLGRPNFSIAPGYHPAGVDALLAEDRAFVPARPAARSPVMRRPVTAGDRARVGRPETASVMDYANALYGQMLRLLSQAFGRAGPIEEKRVPIDAAIDCMYAPVPAAEASTRMPANDEGGCTAGMSFAMLRPLAASRSGGCSTSAARKSRPSPRRSRRRGPRWPRPAAR